MACVLSVPEIGTEILLPHRSGPQIDLPSRAQSTRAPRVGTSARMVCLGRSIPKAVEDYPAFSERATLSVCRERDPSSFQIDNRPPTVCSLAVIQAKVRFTEIGGLKVGCSSQRRWQSSRRFPNARIREVFEELRELRRAAWMAYGGEWVSSERGDRARSGMSLFRKSAAG